MVADTVLGQGSDVSTRGEKAGSLEFGVETGAGAKVEDVVAESVVSFSAAASVGAGEAMISEPIEDAVAEGADRGLFCYRGSQPP